MGNVTFYPQTLQPALPKSDVLPLEPGHRSHASHEVLPKCPRVLADTFFLTRRGSATPVCLPCLSLSHSGTSPLIFLVRVHLLRSVSDLGPAAPGWTGVSVSAGVVRQGPARAAC